MTSPRLHRIVTVAVALAVASLSGTRLRCAEPNQAPPEQVGATIYKNQCVQCHGADGQGTADAYEKPLYGDLSVDELALLIERTMPEEEPETCVGDQARAVASFIHREFYSREARKAKGLAEPARVELTRLTVSQYRNCVADLMGRFMPEPRRDDRRRRRRRSRDEETPVPVQPGLAAQYYQSKGMNKAEGDAKDRRIDLRVDYDFEDQSPHDDITADQFSISWQGALIADQTGYYEFRVSTQNGARLYLNQAQSGGGIMRDDSSAAGQAALIDAWVSSGKMREREARVFLLGGRQYPLKLEFFKFKDKTASIKLEWKPPQGSWSVLDHHHTTTAAVPSVFVVDTPFPADDRSLGYERGSSVSREWHTAVTNGAVAVASAVMNRLPLLVNLNGDEGEVEQRLEDFLVRFARAAYRRPLTDEEDRLMRGFCRGEGETPEQRVGRAIHYVMNSPLFLYTDLTPAGQPPTPHAVASRLALTLWDSLPDEELIRAADEGQLDSPDRIREQARRMIDDPRARAKMRGFFRHWLEIEERDLAKDKDMFPEFDEAVIADLRFSLERFLEQVIWSDDSDYRQLLSADYLVLNDRLRELYAPDLETAPAEDSSASEQQEGDGEEASAQETETEAAASDFRTVKLPPGRRSGLLTHPYLLSAFAYHNNTSPIHRGVFLTRNIIGRGLKPPPIAVAFKNDEFPADLTMREKITQLTRDSACMSCHSVINPLGFALENFDAVGRWRNEDNDKPVDSRSRYVTEDGRELEVASAADIARFAIDNSSAHEAFVSHLFHHLVKQDASAYGPETSTRLRDGFASDEFNIRHLMVEIAALAAARDLESTPPPEESP